MFIADLVYFFIAPISKNSKIYFQLIYIFNKSISIYLIGDAHIVIPPLLII